MLVLMMSHFVKKKPASTVCIKISKNNFKIFHILKFFLLILSEKTVVVKKNLILLFKVHLNSFRYTFLFFCNVKVQSKLRYIILNILNT